MDYALVFWVDENKYSVVSLKRIQADKTQPLALVGNVYPVKWSKGQVYNAEVKAIGSKQEMVEQEGFWEEKALETSFTEKEVTEAGGGHIITEGRISGTEDTDLNQSSDESDQMVEHSEAVATDTVIRDNRENQPDCTHWEQKRILELETELTKKDSEIAKEKAKNRNLRRLVKKTMRTETSSETVEIGCGVKIAKTLDDFLKSTYLGTPSLFLRKLAFDSGVFSIEEIATSSITGKRTIQSPADLTRPALDPTRFKVLKDYTIVCCSLQINTLEMLKFESRIRHLCTDARKKLKAVN